MYVCGGAGGGGQRDYFFAYLSILYLNFAVFFLILLSYLLTSAHSRNDSLYVLLIIIQAKLVKKLKKHVLYANEFVFLMFLAKSKIRHTINSTRTSKFV